MYEHHLSLWKKADIDPLINKFSSAQADLFLKRQHPIRPLVRRHNESVDLYEPWFIKVPHDIGVVAYQWAPQWTDRAHMSELEEFASITTYHVAGHISMFKPDLREIISQIPTGYLSATTAFMLDPTVGARIVDYPSDVGQWSNEMADKFYGHQARVILYKKKGSVTPPRAADYAPKVVHLNDQPVAQKVGKPDAPLFSSTNAKQLERSVEQLNNGEVAIRELIIPPAKTDDFI